MRAPTLATKISTQHTTHHAPRATHTTQNTEHTQHTNTQHRARTTHAVQRTAHANLSERHHNHIHLRRRHQTGADSPGDGCQQCLRGTFSDGGAAAACTIADCNPGSYVPPIEGGDAHDCEPCPPGSWSVGGEGGSFCLPSDCGKGQGNGQWGAFSAKGGCAACTAGESADGSAFQNLTCACAVEMSCSNCT